MLKKVSLPQEWANDWYKWLDKDEKQEQILAEENVIKLKEEIINLDKKLNILLDSFLDQIIDSEIYKQKKNEIFDQKLQIQEQITRIKTDGSSWLEPMKNFIGSALSCAKIARAKNTNHDLAIMAKTVGSNLLLHNQRLQLQYNLGFATLCAPPTAQRISQNSLGESISVTPTILSTDCENSLKPFFL